MKAPRRLFTTDVDQINDTGKSNKILVLCIIILYKIAMRTVYDHGRYQCLLLEAEDLDDPVGAELALEGHFLDFPYAISEGTKTSVMGVLRGKLGRDDEAHFVLWDKEQSAIVGRAQIEDLGLEKEDRPEISQSYIAMDRRGERLIDWLYKGRLQFLSEHGYEHVKAKIDQLNTASMKAATRNGFNLYQPANGNSVEQSSFHVTRSVAVAPAATVKHDAPQIEQRI